MLFILLLQITPSVPLRMLTGQKPSGGWREKKGYREAGGRKERECLQGLCVLLSVTVLHAAESLKTELRAFGLHGPFGNLRDFTHRSRFLAFLENSSVLAIPSQHFYVGRQLAGK